MGEWYIATHTAAQNNLFATAELHETSKSFECVHGTEMVTFEDSYSISALT